MRRFLQTLALIGCVAALHGATLERLTLEQMISKSTAIVRGTVTGSSAAFSGPVIYTHYTVQVSEQYKGAAGSSVDVVVPGGTVNGVRQSFSGAPALNQGEQYVLMLWTGKSGLTQVIGLTQGLFELSSATTSDPTLTRTATRELMLDAQTGQPVKDQTLTMHLSELRTRISSVLAGKAN